MPTTQEMKEREILETPVLLFDCELRNGEHETWATHRVVFESRTYEATLIEHSGFEIRGSSEDGIDASARAAVTLANADSHYSQIERAIGFKGARLLVRFAFFNLATGEPATEAVTIFRGTGNAAESIREASIRLSFHNRLNFQRILLPDVRIQKRCPWLFPASAEQRLESVTGGERGGYNPLFHCGYSPGEEGGAGSLNAGVPFTSCDYTRASCEQRGMFSTDSGGQITRRFGGIEFVPSSVLVRGYGDRAFSASAVQANEAKYNDFVPLLYGTSWVQPPVTLARNDGNLTRMEALLGLGEIEGVWKVIVNDVEIPAAVEGTNMTSTGWYHLISHGNRTGGFNLNFTDAAGAPLGDPYGSMAYLSIVVPNRVQDGKSLPRVQVLVQGMKLPTYGADSGWIADVFTNNPAWVLLDVLRRSGWRLDEIDLPSFAETAQYCDDLITTVDLNGSAVSIPRLQCNLALTRRRSAAEVLRGIRNAAGLYLTFGAEGKLSLAAESTVGVQQGTAPPGTNAVEPLYSGWPAYEFDERSILRSADGEPRLRLFSRGAADTPNRYSIEFQDSFNEYQQDSLSLLDPDDVLASGQETSAAFAALGLPHFDQAARMMQLQLFKSVRGNVYVEFETSVRAIGLKPGDLITMTYTKEGLSRQLFRITRVVPGLNFRTVQLTAQWHDESWYVLTAGDGAVGSRRQPRFELGLPRPLVGKVLDEEGVAQFEIAETYTEATDGTAKTQLTAGFVEPVRPGLSKASFPLLSLAATVTPTGGTLDGDQTLYYALAGVDDAGQEGPLSFVVRAVIPPGTSTNQVTLTHLSFGPGAAAFHVYRGRTPQQMARIASGVALADSFADTGLAAGLIGPPDENYDHANFYWRLELQGEQPATIASATTIGHTALLMLSHEWRGKLVRIVGGHGRGQERRITDNTATTCTVERPWEETPDSSSLWAVVEPAWVAAASTVTSPATFEVPNREGATIQVLGLAANANNRECLAELSPLTRWRILGASGVQLDIDVPPLATFGMATLGDGSISLESIGFTSLDNTRSITAGTLGVLYWDELSSPAALALAAGATAEAETVTVTVADAVTEGAVIQIDAELMRVTAISAGGNILAVERGTHGTAAAGHDPAAPVYTLDRKTFVLPFGRDFFGSPASGSYAYSMHLPSVRVAAGELYLTNSRGNSPTAGRNVTGTTENGLRTLQGGQLTLQVEGWLAIEDDAAPPLIVESAAAFRDVFAMVSEAPTIAPIELRVRQDEDVICTLEIPIGAVVSAPVDGFGLPPLRAGAVLHLDITSVAAAAGSSPGSDLTVTIRL